MDGGGEALKCEADEKICNDQCVKIDNPLFGCAGTGCAPCNDAPFVDQISCKQGKCEVSTCVAGRGDCDMGYPNGCEISTVTSQRCGSCSNACTGGTPLCAESADGGFGCIATCASQGLASCGDAGACVNTATSAQNCGACGNACKTPINGTASCVSSNCVPACRQGSKFNADGGACVTDPKACLPTSDSCSNGVQCCSGSCQAKLGERPVCMHCGWRRMQWYDGHELLQRPAVQGLRAWIHMPGGACSALGERYPAQPTVFIEGTTSRPLSPSRTGESGNATPRHPFRSGPI